MLYYGTLTNSISYCDFVRLLYETSQQSTGRVLCGLRPSGLAKVFGNP